MAAYYNEIDAYAAEWLRNLIKAGHIADGEVDTRSIVDVQPDELREFTQCHFFAGIAGWSHALRLAGWEDERQIWTGSCPCQPFSTAGKGKGTDDPRHLWPHLFRLIRGCRPPVVMGEQVAGAAGYGWLDGVRSDLESEDYAIEGVDIAACSVNAPHIRQRLYWVANSKHARRNAERLCGHGEAGQSMGEGKASSVVRSGEDGAYNLANAKCNGTGNFSKSPSNERRKAVDTGTESIRLANRQSLSGGVDARNSSGMADADSPEWRSAAEARNEHDGKNDRWEEASGRYQLCGSTNYWHDAIWLNGADGKTRRAQPDICLLANGVPARVGKLRAYGNAIVPPLAAEVIKAFMETL